MAAGGGPRGCAGLRLRGDRARARRHRARAGPRLPAPHRRCVPCERRAQLDLHVGHTAALHRARGCGGVPHEPVQHRRRGPALLRSDRRCRRRALSAQLAGSARDRGDVCVGRGGGRGLGADPGRAPGVPPDERDHHVADAQLRRGAAPQLPDLRQPLVLARHLHAGRARLPAGQDAAGPGDVADVARARARRSRSASGSRCSSPPGCGRCTGTRASASSSR